MGGYVLRRVLFTIPTLIGISLIIFFMVRLLPGDYIDILGGDTSVTDGAEGGGPGAARPQRVVRGAVLALGQRHLPG